MPEPTLLWLALPVATLLGILFGSLIRAHIGRGRVALSEQRAKDREREAELTLKSAEIQVREELQQRREELESDFRMQQKELDGREQNVMMREREAGLAASRIAESEGGLLGRENRLVQAEEGVRARMREADARALEAEKSLERIASLTREAAREQILRAAGEEVRATAARMAAQIRSTAVREAERDARRIIGIAVQRLSSDHTIESTVTVVDLPSDDMKGRIIGREGRNIRSFEMATGVDVIIDDTPEAVLLSSFDPVRREVARRSLLTLIEDGRIHPGRIEEVVQKVEEEVRTEQAQGGERAAMEVGVPALSPEILQALGRLEYRSSFGQNVLRHSVEVGRLAGLLASELRLEAGLARRIGLLHDLGKSLDQDHEGSHALSGADFLRRCGERPQVFEAVGAHHGEIESTSPYTWIVQAADAISGARPGARREKLETYVKRLEQLEALANAYPGVARSFAIQAGRELRILVHSREVSDSDAEGLAASLASRIEKELQYPGQIKVMVIRETRAVEIAR